LNYYGICFVLTEGESYKTEHGFFPDISPKMKQNQQQAVTRKRKLTDEFQSLKNVPQ